MEQPAKEIVVSQKEEKKQEIKEVKKAEPVQKEEQKGLKPKRIGYSLFTASAVVKTANGKFSVTRIIEEKTEKMVKAAFEKAVKNDLGKARSVTKFYMKPYSIGDENITEEIIEKPAAPAVVKEPTIFEKALEILCTSPYIHLYKTPKVKTQPSTYLVAQTKDELVDMFMEKKEKAQEMINTMSNIADFAEVDEKAYSKLINETKRMSGQEIKNDKNAIRTVGSKSEEALQAIIDVHEAEAYKEEHKYEIVEKNIRMIMDSGNLGLFKIFLPEYEDETSSLIIADTADNAKLIATCTDYMHDFIEEHTQQSILTGDKVTITVGVKQYQTPEIDVLLKGIDVLLSRDNACSEALVDPEFTVEKWELFLSKVKQVGNMTSEEKQRALDKLANSKFARRDDFKSILDKIGKRGNIEKRIIGTI